MCAHNTRLLAYSSRTERHLGSVSDTGRIVQSPQDTHSGTPGTVGTL